MFKKISIICLIAIGSLPLLANAGIFSASSNLTIVNNTNRDSTSRINGGPCSTFLGAVGITHAHSVNVVPARTVGLACIANRANCTANVYMTSNCSGPVVGTVILDISSGIKSIALYDKTYSVSGSGFGITIGGGPA